MAEIVYLGPLITIILLGVIIYLILRSGISIGSLIVNSVIGIILLLLINLFPIIDVDINIWSILIVALGGIPGLILVILLSMLGIAF